MYVLLRPLLFRRDPESAHESVITLLAKFGQSAQGRALVRTLGGSVPRAPFTALGLHFSHPVGMAAGFDKNAVAVQALQELGFSHVEVGTVTPRPQEGNPKPRVWRFPSANALVNSLGFPSEGMAVVRKRLEAIRAGGHLTIPIGINLGKNRDTSAEQAVNDYLAVLDEMHDVGDYFVINVSSPNTPGLRDLQAPKYLRPLTEAVMNRVIQRGQKPVLLKIAPDLADHEISEIVELCRILPVAGIIAGNTTIQRELVKEAKDLDRGGLSGAPLFPRTLEMVTLLRKELAGGQIIVAAGGIDSSRRLEQTLAAGANLVQVYTAFIYHGPRCVKKLMAGGFRRISPPKQ